MWLGCFSSARRPGPRRQQVLPGRLNAPSSPASQADIRPSVRPVGSARPPGATWGELLRVAVEDSGLLTQTQALALAAAPPGRGGCTVTEALMIWTLECLRSSSFVFITIGPPSR